MNIKELLTDKSKKPKEKIEELSKWLLDKKLSVDELLEYAGSVKDAAKANCIEALEFATKQQPDLGNAHSLVFVTHALKDKAPRVKWESAKVIGNIAHLHPRQLDEAISNLLVNTEHEGTVVRWSAAYALGEILKLGTPINKTLLPAAEAICEREEKNSIKKIYQAAIKKIPK